MYVSHEYLIIDGEFCILFFNNIEENSTNDTFQNHRFSNREIKVADCKSTVR